MDWVGYGWMGWDLCVGLLYEHRFAMLIRVAVDEKCVFYTLYTCLSNG